MFWGTFLVLGPDNMGQNSIDILVIVPDVTCDVQGHTSEDECK
jgi:hypothetical protein